MLKKYRGFAVILAASLALCLLAPLWREDKFPYTGTWTFQRNGNKGMETSITFDASGACSMNYTGSDRRYTVKNTPCPYEMDGRDARMQLDFPGNYDIADPAKQHILTTYKARVTPQNQGRTLRIELLEGQKTYRALSKTWQTKTENFVRSPLFLEKLNVGSKG